MFNNFAEEHVFLFYFIFLLFRFVVYSCFGEVSQEYLGCNVNGTNH